MHTDKLASVHLIELLVRKGIKDFIVSPGSRNAPLIMELVSRKDVNLYSVADERSAAFVAIGMYQKTGKPVAITCTSGSAILNYAPAVSEAYYQAIPLIILSADRPAFWIDKGEGQTIRQRKALSNFIHAELNIETDNNLSDYQLLDQKICECIDLSMYPTPGPVHINIEYEEPLYNKTEKIDLTSIRFIERSISRKFDSDFESFVTKVSESKRVMILCGQMLPNRELSQILDELSHKKQVVVITESTSNLHSPRFIPSIDKTLMTLEKRFEEFRPDILISIGDAIISKIVKRVLRDHPPKEHWQINEFGVFRDTYKVLSHPLYAAPQDFMRALLKAKNSSDADFGSRWRQQYDLACKVYESIRHDLAFSDLKVFDLFISSISKESDVHIANSSAIRYQQLFENANINTYCNRGTSGIDGCSSTAIGFSLKNERETWLISGDISFLYDSNAFWNNYRSDLKIILINNGGGGIFRIIPGPKEIKDYENYIEAHHSVSIEALCKAYQLDYSYSDDSTSFSKELEKLKATTGPALLEVKTPREQNAVILKDYFDHLKKEDNQV